MKRIIIFGNSGSGKSTLAKKISVKHKLGHLDLDTSAWQNTIPPKRLPIGESQIGINEFLINNDNWVIEGCYSDLLELILSEAGQAIFMDISVEECIENAKNRPWEPHKYKTKDEQDTNLPILIDWIKDYTNRSDTFSRKSHLEIFNQFQGTKILIKSNEESADYIL